MKKQVSKTVMHKCTFSNLVHDLLETEQGKPNSQRTPTWKRKKLTDAEKIELFDKIAALHAQCSEAIGKSQYDRRVQKRREKRRVESGYYEKKASRKDTARIPSGKVA